MADDRPVVVETGGGGGGAVVALVLGVIVILIALYVIFGTNLLRGVSHDINANVTITTPAPAKQ